MSVKKVATNQPEFFKFSDENLNKAKKIIKEFPEKKQYEDAKDKVQEL